MTWIGKIWHIDHIIPIALAKNKEEVIKLNHYTNLRPYWGDENLEKSAKIDLGLIKEKNLIKLY